MAFQSEPVGHFGEHLADRSQQLAHVGLHDGAAAREHRALIAVDDLDAQAVGRHVEPDLRLERRQLGAVGQLAFERVLETLQPLELGAALRRLEGLQVDGLAVRLVVARLHLATLAREIGAAALDDMRRVARAAAAHQRDLER